MALHLVTGKGGVGKTRVSAILSKSLPSALLYDCSGDLPEELELLKLKDRQLMQMSESEIIYRAIKPFLKIGGLSRWVSENKWIRNLFNLAPNMMDFLQLYEWSALSREQDVIVDAPSTGNFLGIIDSVKPAKKMFEAGKMNKMAREMEDLLNDPAKTRIYLVSLPETSALHEMQELHRHLTETGYKFSILQILNRLHQEAPPEVTIPEELKFLAYDRPKREMERIQGIHFDRKIWEGGLDFA